jgi:hypothetical protein
MGGPQGRPGAGPAGPTYREAARVRMQVALQWQHQGSSSDGEAVTAVSGQQQGWRGSGSGVGAAKAMVGTQ